MAKDIKFNIRLNIDGKDVIVSCKKGVEDLGKALGTLPSASRRANDALVAMGAVASTLQGVYSSIQNIAGVVSQLTAAYQTQQESELKLETVMRERMSAADADIASIMQLAAAQQKLGVIGDEVQLAGAQQVATFLNEKGSIEKLLPAMNNLAVQRKGLNVTAEDMVSIANLVGKAMQGQVSALTRVGITMTEAQKSLVTYGSEQERAATGRLTTIPPRHSLGSSFTPVDMYLEHLS